MARARHFFGCDRNDRRTTGPNLIGFVVRNRPVASFKPFGGGVNFEQGKIGREEFPDDFFALDHEEARGFAMLFFAQLAQAGNLGLGERHGRSKAAGIAGGKTIERLNWNLASYWVA